MNNGMNSIRLTGRVTELPVYDHSICGEAFYRMRAAVARLSGSEDVLPVTVSERLLSGAPEELLLKPVEISGQIRSYNRRAEDGSHLLITVFAREISFPEEPSALPERNEAELEGVICKPVVYRTTPFLREIADVLAAVPRRYGKCDHIPAIAWGRNARFAEGLEVGARVLLRGRLQSRQYNKLLPDGTGEERTAYELSCSSIERL
ncbi:MAG: single-stranded DNA-binding protein [Clostridia bacterium]|nr:single-stranded DNA-binding protein [Clostridia bacterium]